MNNLGFAFRQLLKNPGFTTVAVLSIRLNAFKDVAEARNNIVGCRSAKRGIHRR